MFSISSRLLSAVALGALAFAAQPVSAATIVGWNLANVVPGPDVAPGATGASVIYDRDVTSGVAGAITNGRVSYTAPEANSPGLKVVNGAFSAGGQNTTGCIMASSTATCDSPFQSGKRFKNQVTGFEPVDFVFDVDPNGVQESPGDPYQVFHRLVNLTGSDLKGFTISLGTGVGSNFVASASGDGLSFSSTFQFGPSNVNVNSQFPFGLFGDAAGNPNFNLDGFFAAERSGFNMVFGEDLLSSNGLYGPYEGIFGPWMSQDAVPTGAFWDFDSNPETDDLLLAWLNADGLWELRRDVVGGVAQTLDTAELFATYADLLARLDPAVAALLGQDVIEDLANLNVNYAIALDGFADSSFTLRVDVAPVPLPAAAPLLLAAFGGAALFGRRRRCAA